jgi:hypothetical protein
VILSISSVKLLITLAFRAATTDFWQKTRLPQWWPHPWRAIAVVAMFYFAKSRQDLSLGGLVGLASHDSPGIQLFELSFEMPF